MTEFLEENTTDTKKEDSLESRFARLDEIVSAMDGDEITLEESFRLYKEGLEQVKSCNALLDQVEKAMLILNEQGQLEEM
ncbi:MAG: exodeoxyribonuclease VII small subunit [Agathobacter sp.]|nr:exodeoxyribonuclease VII small subunit [Agathobacter sp.]MDY3888924.1 exodeoxyribonuclease VII small subunit [Agathobacter sp.]